ncbi:YwbE family protein [Methanofollis formosanus]|uniref:YwbE family protein n=1 Tax=Methanofollis formosanus TaxID=299308 RepID=A0A8G1A1P9_9EURY|nr:YwbE family protein [Methanofollis formosanus]QYZ79073.1 YwbE family protein [Methanofollis formosanus]
MNGQHRKDIKPGITVDIVLKADQKTGKRTRGVVAAILTNSSFHPHGIKVRLRDGKVGRVQEILAPSGDQEGDKRNGPNTEKR